MNSSSRLLLLFMNLKYHVARDAISGLIEAPNSATGHRDALGRGQVRPEQHGAIYTLIGSSSCAIEPIIILIEPSITALIAGIIALIAWIIILIGRAISIALQ